LTATKLLPTHWAFALLLLHVPLGYAMHQSRALATAHAATVILYGIYRAVVGTSATEIACIASYVAGAEVLWRMSSASIPHETGKYAVIILLVTYGLRFSKGKPVWPIFFVALLAPAIIPTFLDLDFSLARQYVSFNLSGPLSLAVCVWFFSGQVFSRDDMGRIGIFFVAPVVSVAAVTLFSTYTLDNIAFRTSSNFATSGGFGPNQVSAVLALGFVMTFFVLFLWSSRKRLFLAGLFLVLPVFLVQSAMTFSRTGIYLAFGSVLAGSMFLMRTPRARFGLIAGATVLVVVANLLILPALDSFTSGMLEARFQEMDTSNRVTIMQHDLAVWEENPVFGVGLGMSRFYRAGFDDAASHTEYSRLLAEHGLFGLTAICMLFVFLSRNIMLKRKMDALSMALSVAFTVYFVGFLFASGMRLVVPSLVLGLSFTMLESIRQTSRQNGSGRFVS
jgi:hypothetical protein